jgi:hypothetical protein
MGGLSIHPLRYTLATAGFLGVKQCFYLLHGIGVARDPVIDSFVGTMHVAGKSVNVAKYSTQAVDLVAQPFSIFV